MLQTKNKTPSILLGFLDFQGYMSTIVAGLSQIGIKSVLVNVGENSLGFYSASSQEFMPRIFKKSHKNFFSSRSKRKLNPIRYYFTIEYMSVVFMFILWVLVKFDVVYFKGGESILGNHWDIRLFKLFGITTATHFAGSDSRPPYLHGFCSTTYDAEELVEATRQTYERVRKANAVFDIVIDNPLASQFHSKQCVIGQCLGTVVNSQWVRRVASADGSSVPKSDSIVIMHAPSLREVKGSNLIEKEIDKLAAAGHDFIYKEIHGKSNKEVLREFAAADLVIDNLYSDTFGATVTAEAATLGVPSISGSYGHEELLNFIPSEAIMPCVLVHPDRLGEVILQFLTDKEKFKELGAQAYDFVESRNNERGLAERFLRVVTGECPQDWTFSPSAVTYVGGVGGAMESIRLGVAKVVSAGGPSALCVDNKPELKKRLLALIESDFESDPTRSTPDCA